VHAGSGNVMCSYQRLNNSYGCANSKTLNGLLKTELGFQGFVVSDWYAQQAGVATALSGLDVAMPNADGFWGDLLVTAVNNGSVPESRIDDMAIRIIAPWYQMGQDTDFPTPGIGMPSDLTAPHTIIDGRNPAFKDTLLQGAIEGHVLVKNKNSALPLSKPKLLSVYGYSAKNPDINQPGTAWQFGSTSYNITELFSGFTGSVHQDWTPIASNGTLYSGGGSGATSQSAVIAPWEAIVSRAYDDDTMLFWNFADVNPAVNAASDACLVIVNAFASEAFDRSGTSDNYTDTLIGNVAGKCANTIVVFHNAGVRHVEKWIDHANVTALIFAHLPGQYSGKALVSLLYGDSNPSGKLPYTVAKNDADYPVLGPDWPTGDFALFPQSNFSEGVFIDYRHFDAKNITPRFEFGFGLSYTTFGFANLAASRAGNATFSTYPTGPVLEGGQSDLWDIVATVTAEVTNTGNVTGAEVAQLYVGIPVAGQPVRQLRGFEKATLLPGEMTTVSFDLTRRDLSVWDTTAQKWKLPSGAFSISVGSSSRALPLTGSLVL
jgi:beta-glucosidase